MARLSRLLLGLMAVAFPLATIAAQGGYHVVKRVQVGGEGGWDYLTPDPDAHRVFLSRGSHVMVFDTEKDTVIADIPDTPGVHGVALAHDLNRGFTSNGRDSTVTIFDLASFAVIAKPNIGGRNPDAILYDAPSKRLFTFNGGSANASALDAATGKFIGLVPLGGKPETGVSYRGRVLVNVEDKNEIVAFNPKTLAVIAHWSIAPCEEPTGLALDEAHSRLIVGCGGNKMMAVVDANNGKVVATVPAGEGIDAAWFDPSTQLAFVSSGDGNVTVVHEDSPDKYSVVTTVQTERGARTMTLDPRTHKLYTVSAKFGETPAPTADRPRPRPPMIPGSFMVIVIDR